MHFLQLMSQSAAESLPNLAYPDMNVLFKAVVAAYLLYVSVLGKGKLLDNKFLKLPKEKFRLYMRLTAGAGALFVLGTAAIEFLGAEGSLKTVATVLWVLGLIALVGMLVLNIVCTDRKAQLEAQRLADAEMVAKQRNKMRAAFEFDDEDSSSDENAAVEEAEFEKDTDCEGEE